ncbi:phosphoribosylformimino-5-aminoimidazole carboxamide ribotide isomerase [Ereboglobus sp. PH5-5]|nr:phosphoribosylformimino-5-aminoimidazole carboxamide ribotide isomerase [Ereboglobus sp. PH5-5]
MRVFARVWSAQRIFLTFPAVYLCNREGLGAFYALSTMTIYPAIDIKGGRCVRLTQGRADQQTIYSENPAEIAAQFKAAGSGWVHVVDLDGAFSGESQNLAVVREIVAAGMRVQLGGGMRSREAVERALALGVSRVVVGTRAAESEEFVRELVGAFGPKVAVGIDAKDGMVAVKGWVSTTGTSALALAQRMDALGVSTLIYTDIGTDGMLTGPNLAAQEAMLKTVKCGVIASGGVSQQGDVGALGALAKRHANLDGVIIGKAIYEKRVDLAQAIADARA